MQIRKNLYRWHRIASLITAVPVLLWALSGLMHPLMTNIRPRVQQQSIVPEGIDTALLKTPLQRVLQQNQVTRFNSVRLVKIGRYWFYQLQLPQYSGLVYFSAWNGKLLHDGDALYARYLATRFLQGDGPVMDHASTRYRHPLYGSSTTVAPLPAAAEDCCDAASSLVIQAGGEAAVKNVRLLEGFTSEYKPINHLLPVYRVDFDRPDAIRIYVDTHQDRFAFAMDRRRAVFDTFFQWFHTWAWLEVLGKGKNIAEAVFAGLAFVTALMGLYLFCTTRAAKSKGSSLVKARRNHRYTAVAASLFTLLFAFSGGYHALFKVWKPAEVVQEMRTVFAAAQPVLNWQRLYAALDDSTAKVTNIGLVNLEGRPCWQVFLKTAPQAWSALLHRGDLMQKVSAALPEARYVDAQQYRLVPEGDCRYAAYLAGQFSGHPLQRTSSCLLVTRFNEEYGFINKRLPVWRIGDGPQGQAAYFIETATSQLAARITRTDRYEGYSFAFLHKHHFLDGAGKQVRDISTMIAAALQILLVSVGLVFYFRWRKKTATKKQG